MKGKEIPQCLSMEVVYSSHTYEVTTDDAKVRQETAEIAKMIYSTMLACQISHVRFDNLEKAIGHYVI